MVSSWLLFQQMCSLFPRESGNGLVLRCVRQSRHCCLLCATGVCAELLDGRCRSGQGICEEDHGITMSPEQGWQQAGGQSSGPVQCNPLGSSLLLSKGCPLGHGRVLPQREEA